MAPLNILIVGCSIAGPTLASFLLLSSLPATEKPHIMILERSSCMQKRGQNIDVRGTGVTISRRLGIESAIRKATTGEVGAVMVDEQDRVWARNAADNTGKVSTPTAELEILRGTLARICYQRCRSISEDVQSQGGKGVEFVFGDYLDELEQDRDTVSVHFAKSGERRNFDIVVGADGLQSGTRKLAFGASGEKDRVKRLGMFGAFFSIPKGSTDSSWRRWYHAPGRRFIMVRPSGEPDTSTIFMAVINEQDERLVKVAAKGREDLDAQKALMEEYFHDIGWESKRILQGMRETDDFYYDLIGQVKMDSYSKGRVVLLGDAGYCASPISGMGTTLAFTGAYHLAGSLLGQPNDHTTAFQAYESKMRPIATKAQKLVPGAPYILAPDSAWTIFLLHWFLYLFKIVRIGDLVFAVLWVISSLGLTRFIGRVGGVGAHDMKLEDYGFRSLPEWNGFNDEELFGWIE